MFLISPPGFEDLFQYIRLFAPCLPCPEEDSPVNIPSPELIFVYVMLSLLIRLSLFSNGDGDLLVKDFGFAATTVNLGPYLVQLIFNLSWGPNLCNTLRRCADAAQSTPSRPSSEASAVTPPKFPIGTSVLDKHTAPGGHLVGSMLPCLQK